MPTIHNFEEFEPVLDLIRISTKNVDKNFHIYPIHSVQNIGTDFDTPFFRQAFFDITLFQSIDFIWNYSGNVKNIGNNTLQIVPPRQVQKINMKKETIKKIKGYTLYFKPEFLSIGYDNKKFLRDFPFFLYGNMDVLVNMTKKQIQDIVPLIKQINVVYSEKAKYHRQIINGLLWSLLHTIKGAWETQYNEQNFTPSDLVTRLEQEIQNHFDFSLKISDYADMLHISPKYLSQRLKKETGQSAKNVLDANFLLEAKTLLRCTNGTVAQIAYKLGYSEPSAFNRFFKRLSGQTPESFRKNISFGQ